MKRAEMYLNGIKYRYFMLLVCIPLLMGVTSCGSDEFENNLPEESQQLSKAELIELALSRVPQTRAAEPYPVVMATTRTTVSVSCYASEAVIIYWGDGDSTLVPPEDFSANTHSYSDDEMIHPIYIESSNDAIMYLDVYQNGLIFLDVTGNVNLLDLFCARNDLDELDLTDCPNLEVLWAGGNNFSSIDLTHLLHLRSLTLSYNQFTDIDLSKNLELKVLGLGCNPITDLDLTNNTALMHIDIQGLLIETIDNIPINAKSFAVFPQLEELDVSRTPFTSLDFSDNPLMSSIFIEGTAITQLDISNLQIEVLDASDSQLTSLKYTANNLKPNCRYVDILGTPFETNRSNVLSLISALPDRRGPNENGIVTQGKLFTTSSAATLFLSMLTGKNWVVYTE